MIKEPTRTDAFAQKMVQTLNAGATALMISVGHRTRLFDTMAEMPASTSAQIAAKAGLSERYVREWLGGMLASGVVEYDAVGRTFSLPPEHAACLTRAATPNNMAASCQWIGLMGDVESVVVDAFAHGKGVPYAAYHRFHEVMAEESAQTVVAALTEHILPLVPGLIPALRKGIDVLDIGCGAGRAVNALARVFPNSRFAGYDLSRDAVEMARAESRQQNLANVRFEVRDLAEMYDTAEYDLVTAFDVIHDQAKPDAVLRNVHRALRPGAVFLMQDIMGSSRVEKNVDYVMAPMLYAVSCMHCMSVSLANGGPGLGSMWGKEKALEMLAEAGFYDVPVTTLPHDPMNYYYVGRRGR